MGALNTRSILKLFGTAVGALCAGLVTAGELTVPNQFSNGQATSASEMNANFSAVESAVNDNDQRISQLEGQGPVVFQGFSLSTIDGAQGLRTMTQACDSTYPGSRMCSTAEYRDSPFNPNAENLDSPAWINPVILGIGTPGATSNQWGIVEAVSGAISLDSQYLSCRGWSASDLEGMLVSETGQMLIGIASSGCNQSNRVSCCK
ncbi:MAG TPA: hypothetical protein DIC49_07215 [Gammaproteobacteria bacterium]|nr:hypothetical protein [Gammaproteobacteria bacterium]